MRRGLGSVVALVAFVLLCASAPVRAATRDDTDMLQAKLDGGGAIFLSKLPDGRCYATRGLWLSRDDTRITSDGACIVALGLGRAQVDPRAKKPHYANAVFDISHSDVRKPVPARVSISGLRIVVPKAKRMHGILVEGNAVSLSHLAIAGAPLTGISVGYGIAGDGAMSERIAITDNTVSGAQRDGIVAYGPIDLRVERNVVSSAGSSGIHVRAADRGQPVIDVRVVGNTANRNGGAGIFVDLDPTNGVPVFARGIEVAGNRLVRNGLGAQRALRAGLLVAGRGEVALGGNTFSRNRGRALLRRGPRAVAAEVPGRSVAPPSRGDDTAWLQARLDRGGGTIFLPKLPGDACYATRGLWVSHDHTTITSDGACVVSLGLGPVRLHSND
ncbi:MAG: right-handed parallel beta-helix repeat-containing protein, partial [Gaiellaceae bacterium]